MSEEKQRDGVVKSLGFERMVDRGTESGRAVLHFQATTAMCHSGNVVQGGFITGWIDMAMANVVMAQGAQGNPLVAGDQGELPRFRAAGAGDRGSLDRAHGPLHRVRRRALVERGGRCSGQSQFDHEAHQTARIAAVLHTNAVKSAPIASACDLAPNARGEAVRAIVL